MLYLLIFVLSSVSSMAFFFLLKKRKKDKNRTLLINEIAYLQSALQNEMAILNMKDQDLTSLLASLQDKKNMGKCYYIYNTLKHKQYLLSVVQ